MLGIVLGEKAKVLAPLGDIFLNLMFTIVVPMVFVSIASAVGNMVNMKRLGRIMGSLVTVFVVTGAIAGVLVLVVVNIFPPAAGTSIQFASAQMEEMSSVGDMIVGALTVDDFSGLMSRRNMLPIIVFAILSGFCVSACGGEESPVGKLLNNLNAIIMKIVSIIMMYAPIGLGAYFASLVGEFGPGLIGDYGHAMLVYYPFILLYRVSGLCIFRRRQSRGRQDVWAYPEPGGYRVRNPEFHCGPSCKCRGLRPDWSPKGYPRYRASHGRHHAYGRLRVICNC